MPHFLQARSEYVEAEIYKCIRCGEFWLSSFNKPEDQSDFQVKYYRWVSVFNRTNINPDIVSVPSVSVEGEKEKHVMAGSPVELKCFIKNCLKQPTYVFW
jgi:hypothetical protein